MKGMPAVERYDEQFQFLLPDGMPIPYVEYKIYADDKVLEEKASRHGLSSRLHTKKQQDLRTKLQWMDFDADKPFGEA